MEGVVLKKCARLALCILTVIMLGAVAPSVRVAQAGGVGSEQEIPAGGGEADRWWGAYGAMLCGAEIRLIVTVPAVGMQPPVLAAGLGACLLAALDIYTTK